MSVYNSISPEATEKIIGMIEKSENIVIAVHSEPDVDAITSAYSFRYYLKMRFGKKCVLFAPNNSKPNKMLEMVKFHKPDNFTSVFPEKTECCVILDCGNVLNQTGLSGKDASFFIGFDHHNGENWPDFPENGTGIQISGMPSTTSVLLKFFNAVGFSIDSLLASWLLAGLLTDTGKLTNDGTNVLAFEMVAELCRRGANYNELVQTMAPSVTLEDFHAQTEARKAVKFEVEKGLAFLSCSLDEQYFIGHNTQALMMMFGPLLMVDKVRVAVIGYQRPDGSWYYSLRSNSKKGMPIVELAQNLGGGGRPYASGFVTLNAPNKIFREVCRFLDEAK